MPSGKIDHEPEIDHGYVCFQKLTNIPILYVCVGGVVSFQRLRIKKDYNNWGESSVIISI